MISCQIAFVQNTERVYIERTDYTLTNVYVDFSVNGAWYSHSFVVPLHPELRNYTRAQAQETIEFQSKHILLTI